jgi:TPR repeat protein
LAEAEPPVALQSKNGEIVLTTPAKLFSLSAPDGGPGSASGQNIVPAQKLPEKDPTAAALEALRPEDVPALRQKAEEGDANSQVLLGLAYLRGIGVKPDLKTAVEWVRKAADQSNATAQNLMGVFYGRGLGVPHDEAEAVRWYRLSADQGYVYSENSLANRYYSGLGVKQDWAEAIRWWRKAAEAGYARAQGSLAERYFAGEGVPVDKAEAVNWWRKAADQGDTPAQHNLGIAYEGGAGVPENLVTAYMWYRLAASVPGAENQKDSEAACKRVARRMTKEQIAEGDRLAADWLRQHGRDPSSLAPVAGLGSPEQGTRSLLISAKTVAVVGVLGKVVNKGRLIWDPDPARAKDKVEKAIQRWGRWTLVQDPVAADLVLLIVEGNRNTFLQPGKLVEQLLVFQGGSLPAKDEVPLWQAKGEESISGRPGDKLVEQLRKQVEEYEKAETQRTP